MTAAVRASRVRKCRFRHRCGLCPALVLVGQSEGLVTGVGWVHVDPCIIASQRGAR